MTSSFLDLKRSRAGAIDALTKELEKQTAKVTYQEDDGYYQPTVGKDGNGMAIIRFLPEPSGEQSPVVRIFEHYFKGPTGRWYHELSLTTQTGMQDPVSDYNTQLWNTGTEENKAIARAQKRQLRYVSNILVVSDPAKPENEGKVFLFKYGKKIYDMWFSKIRPEEGDDEEAIDVFNPWEGANFKLTISKVEGYRNYDKSKFLKRTPIADTDKEIEAIWNQCKSLEALVAPDKFKTYEELKGLLESVLGIARSSTPVQQNEDSVVAAQALAPVREARKPPAAKSDADGEDEYSDEFFEKLRDEA